MSDNIDRFLSHLQGVKKTGKDWVSLCPAHEDRKPSLSVSSGDDGRVLVCCHAGCTAEAIVSAIGLSLADLMPEGERQQNRSPWHLRVPRTQPGPSASRQDNGRTFATADKAMQSVERKLGKHSALWTYHDHEGQPVGIVVRWDLDQGKTIRPIARNADGTWRIGAMDALRPLYNLPDLDKTELVIVVEGEKCADAAQSIGFTATTSAGGSQAAAKSDWTPLAGKEVWILPDADSPGRKYADDVVEALQALTPAPRIKVVDLLGLEQGGDLVDWMAAFGDAAEVSTIRLELEKIAEQVPYADEPSPGDPEILDDLASREFPTHALPPIVREFVEAGASAIGCDTAMIALPLLVAMASAIGNSRRLRVKRGWFAPPILWGAVVGESGSAKTPAFKLALAPLRRLQRQALKRFAEAMKEFKVQLTQWTKEEATWKRSKSKSEPPERPAQPQAERFIVSDATVEALAPVLLANTRGVLMGRDELNGWFGSFDRYAKGGSGSDASNWLSMFNAEDVVIDRKTGVPPLLYVHQAAVCVVGGIQPTILQRALSPEHRESGLAARLLLACPPRKPKRWTEAEIDPDMEEQMDRLFERLHELKSGMSDDGEPRPVVVTMSPDAKDAWVTYYNENANEQADLVGDEAAAWSKFEEYAARLALVIHGARWASYDHATDAEPLTLDAESMRSGIELTAWFKGETRRAYALLGETEADRENRRILEWIANKGGRVTARELRTGFRKLQQPGAADNALEQLAKAKYGTWEDVTAGSKGGRPTRVFVLSSIPKPSEPS